MQRGDVFRLRAPRNARGREQQGARFAVLLQADELAALSTTLVAPTSTQALATQFRPRVQIAGADTRVLVEQTTAVDPTRLGKPAGRLTPDELGAVDEALRLVLGLS